MGRGPARLAPLSQSLPPDILGGTLATLGERLALLETSQEQKYAKIYLTALFRAWKRAGIYRYLTRLRRGRAARAPRAFFFPFSFFFPSFFFLFFLCQNTEKMPFKAAIW